MADQAQTNKALEEAYTAYGTQIYNYAYYQLYSSEDAQDVTQETFLRYANTLNKETKIENPQAYIYRVARNLCIKMRQSTHMEIDEGAYPVEIIEDTKLYVDPERASLLSDQRGQVLAATQHLSEEQRTALILKEIEGLGYEEIAEIMGSNPNAVGALLSRGRLRFREAFRMSSIDAENIESQCEGFLPQLSPYLDGKLSKEERARVDAHLGDCPLCRLALDDMREATVSYRSLVPLLPLATLPFLAGVGASGAGVGAGVAGATASASAAAAAGSTAGTATAVATGASLTTKIGIGAVIGLLAVGGTVGGIVATRGGQTTEPASGIASEQTKAVYKMAFIRDGNVYLYDTGDKSEQLLSSPGNAGALTIAEGNNKIIFSKDYRATNPGSLGHWSLEELDTTTGEQSVFGTVERTESETTYSLSGTPDGNTVLYSVVPSEHPYGNILEIKRGMKRNTYLKGVEYIGNTTETYICPSISPDGSRTLCIHAKWSSSNQYTLPVKVSICSMNIDASSPVDLIDLDVQEIYYKRLLCAPAWSPDGSKIAYIGEGNQVWVSDSIGSSPKQLTSLDGYCKNPSWTPDGNCISFDLVGYETVGEEPPSTICIVSAGGEDAFKLTSGSNDSQGHWLAQEVISENLISDYAKPGSVKPAPRSTSVILPSFPKYLTPAEQASKYSNPDLAGLSWDLTPSPTSTGIGGTVSLRADFNHMVPEEGSELWFLVITPDGKKYGKCAEVMPYGDHGGWATTLISNFPGDFIGADMGTPGKYLLMFVEVGINKEGDCVIYSRVCNELTIE